MTDIYLHFIFKHYGLYGNAPVPADLSCFVPWRRGFPLHFCGSTRMVVCVCAIGAYTHGGCTRYWDLAKGERTVSLTNHKKSVRALAIHPYEFTHASASADNIKKWKFPRGEFLMNMRGQNAIINAMSVNQENGTPFASS